MKNGSHKSLNPCDKIERLRDILKCAVVDQVFIGCDHHGHSDYRLSCFTNEKSFGN